MRGAKIVVPLRPPGYVDRPALAALLERHGDRHERGRVLLVSAPAGHGKTAAVADWARSSPSMPTAWVTLDAGDRDESTWWATVRASLEACPGTIPSPPPVPGGPGAPGDRDVVLALLDDRPAGVRLVLDDVHEIVASPALDGLLDLLRHPMPAVSLVLCSRHDPPLALDRLRLQGRLAEVRARDLTFTPDDAARLFAADDLRLSGEQVETLVERTEGWAAALRLTALSLHTAEDPDAFVRDFAGDDRSVADYLVSEVLAHLERAERDVLEAACAASPVPAALVLALGEAGDVVDAVDVLDHLEATTALITATDRHRRHYRVHELLRSHVLARLRRRDPGRLAELHRRASDWFARSGDHSQALRHAALAGDVATTRVLLRTRAIELLARGELDALGETERILARAGDDPRVRLVLGLVAFETGDLDRGEHLIDSADQELDGHDGQDLTVLRRVVATRVALVRGRLDRAVVVGATIDPDAAPDLSLRALALSTRGNTLLATEPERARADCARALAFAEHHDWPYLAVQAESTLALAHTYANRGRRAQAHARAVIDRATDHAWAHSSWVLRAWFAHATADLLAGRPHDTLAHVEQAHAACPESHPHFDSALAVLRGAAELDLGRPLEGWQRIRHARLSRHRRSHEDHSVAFAALLEQQAALTTGRGREAAEVTRAVAFRLDGSAEAALLRARDQWSVRDSAARDTLRPVIEGRHRALTSLGLVEALVLDAEIALAHDELSTARARLQRALELATRFETVRPLLRAPAGVHTYLAEHRGGFGELDILVDRLLGAEPTTWTEPLTQRERDVLELLPTLRSYAEISHDLGLSINTIKTHQRSIYQKLGVDCRRDAVASARQIGLLTHLPPHPPGSAC